MPKGNRNPKHDQRPKIDDSLTIDERSSEEILNPSDMPIETLDEEMDLFRSWLPVLKELKDPDNLSAEDIVNKVTPLSTIVLTKLMMTAKSEKVQRDCAVDLAYMGGMKPVERSQNINVNVLARKEATRLLASELEKYGVEVIDTEGSEVDS